MPSLPLFPLGTVLLPGSRLRLQIFEPRYVAMLEDLIGRDEQARCFGVVAILRGLEVGKDAATDLARVGCEARIDALAVDPRVEQPVFQLVATGTRRFQLDGVDHTAMTPYTTGLVSWLEERAGAPDQVLLRLGDQVRDAHAAYLRRTGLDPVMLEDAPHRLAYRAAEATGLEPHERQAVLQAPDTAARLRLVLELLRREQALAARFRVPVRQAYPGGASLN